MESINNTDKIDKNEIDKINNHKLDKIMDNYNSIFNNSGNKIQNQVCDDQIIIERITRRKSFMIHKNKDLLFDIYRKVMIMDYFKPEIELSDIINFIHKLKTIRPLYKSAVYIDLCQDSKFYVGISHSKFLDSNIEVTDDNMAKSRLKDHRNNGGQFFPTYFTCIYPVITSICSFFGDKEDEDLITILMSKSVGNSVRGGKWASPFIIPDYPNFNIQQIKQKLLDKILL